MNTSERRLTSPAAARNREPILEVLREVLPPRGVVLEIASGSGEHALHFAKAMPTLHWQPSDTSGSALNSIAAWRETLFHEDAPVNLREPIALDARLRPWPVEDFVALVCINLIHIAPWEVAKALFQEAGARLPEGGVFYLYGPFRRDGQHTSESNATFDASLREQNPRWGVRDLEEVIEFAAKHGLALERLVEMPANNLSVVFKRELPV